MGRDGAWMTLLFSNNNNNNNNNNGSEKVPKSRRFRGGLEGHRGSVVVVGALAGHVREENLNSEGLKKVSGSP